MDSRRDKKGQRIIKNLLLLYNNKIEFVIPKKFNPEEFKEIRIRVGKHLEKAIENLEEAMKECEVSPIWKSIAKDIEVVIGRIKGILRF